MNYFISELQRKEVVNIADGTRYGFIGDLEISSETGAVLSIIIVGKRRFWGILGRREDIVFPWSSVKRIGSDLILVDTGYPNLKSIGNPLIY